MMFNKGFILIFVIFGLVSAGSAGRGAHLVEISEYPSSVIIEVSEELRCTGTMLNIFWVLTSTSCLLNTSHQQLTIRAGSAVSISGSGSEHHVANDSFKWHRSHRVHDEIHWHNLALVRVNEPFYLDDERFPVKLPQKGQAHLEVGQLGVVAGYGRMNDSAESAGYLSAHEVPVMDLERCRKMYDVAGIKTIPPHTFCIGSGTFNTSACDADVGAAFMVNNRVYGVVSHIHDDCNTNLPVIVSNVTEYRDFIEEYIHTKWW